MYKKFQKSFKRCLKSLETIFKNFLSWKKTLKKFQKSFKNVFKKVSTKHTKFRRKENVPRQNSS